MRLLLSLMFLPCYLLSCQSKHQGEKKTSLASHFFSITDDEDKGIKEIIKVYGGEVEYGFTKNFGSDNKDAFWITIQKSTSIDNPKVSLELLGSNIAYLFYRNLNNEPKKYSSIAVEVKQPSGSRNFKYDLSLLKDVDERRKIVDKVFDAIKNKDFDAFESYLSDEEVFAEQSKEQLIKDIKTLESKSSSVKELIPYGFQYMGANGNKDFLILTNLIVREKDIHPFTAVVHAKEPSNKALFVDYSFFANPN